MRSLGVVIPTYRSAPYLHTTLASVAGQTRQPDRVLVVDDGSDDETLHIARSWSSRLPLLVIADGERRGAAARRSLGAREAGTDLVALLDHDDVWLPDHLEQLEQIALDDSTLAVADALPWVPGRSIATTSWQTRRALPPPDRQAEAMARQNLVFGCSGVLFPTSLFERAGPFSDRFGGCDDWDMWQRMLAAGAVMVGVGHPTVLFRLSTSSSSADDALLDDELALARSVATGDRPAAVRNAARRAERRFGARKALLEAYQLGRDRQPARARSAALRALRGRPGVALRAIAVLIAPTWAVGQRDDRRWDPRRWANRFR